MPLPPDPRPPRLAALPCHLVRIDGGPDALLVRARGHGLIFGAAGLHLVWGALERVLRQRAGERLYVLGLHGLVRATPRLAAASTLRVPVARRASLPAGAAAVRVPTLTVALQVPMPFVPDANRE